MQATHRLMNKNKWSLLYASEALLLFVMQHYFGKRYLTHVVYNIIKIAKKRKVSKKHDMQRLGVGGGTFKVVDNKCFSEKLTFEKNLKQVR